MRATSAARSASCCGSTRTQAPAADYTVPPDNPFGTALWAYGLRNPFRFSFDIRGSKDLFIGDVGQGTREEINWARFADGLGRRADFGWSCHEGTAPGPTACATGRQLPRADLRLLAGEPALGDRRRRGARPRPPDPDRPLRLRRRLRRDRPLVRPRVAARDRRPARRSAGAQPARRLRRGRLRARVRGRRLRQRRSHPGRGRRPLRPAPRPRAPDPDPGSRAAGRARLPRPHLAARADRRSRARAASAAARRRGSC